MVGLGLSFFAFFFFTSLRWLLFPLPMVFSSKKDRNSAALYPVCSRGARAGTASAYLALEAVGTRARRSTSAVSSTMRKVSFTSSFWITKTWPLAPSSFHFPGLKR